MQMSTVRTASTIAVLAGTYYVMARMGQLAAAAHPVVSSIWPPAGLALFALLRFGLGTWPAVTIGAFLFNATSGVPRPGATFIAVGNTLEAVAGALLLHRVAGFRRSLDRLRDVLAFAGLAGVASTVISATVGVASLVATGAAPTASILPLWLTWWSGDAVGVLVMTPLLLSWAEPRPQEQVPQWRHLETALIFAILIMGTELIFRAGWGYAYGIFPLVGWIALRRGQRGAATAVGLVALSSTAHTASGHGPFAVASMFQSLLLLQMFLGLLSVSALLFGAALTEREHAESKLRTAQERLRHLVTSSPSLLYSLRFKGETLEPDWVSDNIKALSGYSADEVGMGQWWTERLQAQEREGVIPQTPELLAAGHAAREYGFRHEDGTYRWVRDEQRLLRDAAGNPVEAVGSWSDVTKLRQAETRSRESEEQYRLLFDSNPHPMWVYDAETLAFLAVNDTAIRLYGWSRSEFLAMTIKDIRPPEDVGPLLADLAGRPSSATAPHAWRHRRKDGVIAAVEIESNPIVFQGRRARLVFANDVTEKNRLEAQLLQAQKMDAIGQLAGGIAHDFNNLIGIIMGFSELLLKDLAPAHRARRRVEQIQKAADRAATLTRRLLAFSRKQVMQPKVLDLNAVAAEMESMLHRVIGEDIELTTALEPALFLVKADPAQIEQVILNLAVNARDAMPRGGKLILETANVELGEHYARTHAGARTGSHALLAVSDTGHGMGAETLSHIFEPFFTTKSPGKGTGLGLAMVYGIVKQSGGYINVYSEPDQGTTFKVYLPRADEPEVDAEPPPPAEVELPRGSETVVLVEDEASLRELIRECLEADGYTVLEARYGTEALEICERHVGLIHLLMTDVVMPGMSGRELAERVRAARPEMRVLYMSGYTDDAVVIRGVLSEDMAFLQKPFTPEALALKVREVLDAAPPAALRSGP